MPARNTFYGLRCGEKNCRHVIRAATGLREIEKLIVHLRRKHKRTLSMEAALELRDKWETTA